MERISEIVAANFPRTVTISTLMMEAYLPKKSLFLQESYGVASQKMAFFIITTVKTSDLKWLNYIPETLYPEDLVDFFSTVRQRLPQYFTSLPSHCSPLIRSFETMLPEVLTAQLNNK
jgi:hypothetical protein